MSDDRPRGDVAGVSASIATTLAARRATLPRIEREIAAWAAVDGILTELGAAVTDLRDYPVTPPDVAASLAHLQIGPARAAVAAALEQLGVARARVARDTVNIGVSGQARVGKSTLLQSITGLGEDQVPTGSGIPVTAVRSRIFHAPRQRAVIELHTFDTFRDEVLDAYHRLLGLPSLPWTLAEFRDWRYPGPGELGGDRPHDEQTILRRLRDMQSSLPSYAGLLTHPERTIELTGAAFAELRSYVAYPTNAEQESGQPPARRYLAVRDVRIACPFPHAAVERLGITDLPGLGELAAGAEDHHVDGLRNTVDVVLMVKRSVEGMAFWGARDAAAVRLIDRARGFVTERRDFAFLVLNTGGTTEALAGSLRDHIHREVNDGQSGRSFHVLETDAAQPRPVFTDVLVPVLRHLVERLPAMDQQMLTGARQESQRSRELLSVLAADVQTALAAVRNLSAGVPEDLDDRTRELRRNLAESLGAYVHDLRDRLSEIDEDYLRTLDDVHNDAIAWIRRGYDVGRERWCVNALRTMRVDRSSSPFTVQEMNHLRVEIGARFTRLNAYFDEQLVRMWQEVARRLAADLGHLLDAPPATTHTGQPAQVPADAAHRQVVGAADRLRALAGRFAGALPACVTLQEAVEHLLSVRLDYRTHLHPRVRPELAGLDPLIRKSDLGEPMDDIRVDLTPQGAAELYDYLGDLAEQAVYQTRKALVTLSVLPAQVIFAAVEEFEDTLIRSAASEREFTRLARSFRDEIWPGVHAGLDQANVRVGRVATVAAQLAAAVEELGETG